MPTFSLASSLQAKHATAIVQPQAIHGLGGIGKTRLAVDTLGGQETGITPSSLSGRTLRRPSGPAWPPCGPEPPEPPCPGGPLGRGDRTRRLRLVPGDPGWLLILDNVDTKEAEQAVLEILPFLAAGTSSSPPVRRTGLPKSRSALSKSSLRRRRPVSSLDGLRRSATLEADDAEKADDSRSFWTASPLPWRQAAAYINHRRISFSITSKIGNETAPRFSWYNASLMRYPVPWQ